jgi:mono/diheme cytochrome c family protein
MGRLIKRIALGIGVVVAIAAAGLGIYVFVQTSAYDASMAKVYDVAPLALARSTDADIIARGKHLARSIGGCATRTCHGEDLAGGEVTDMGPIGTLAAPNITGVLASYSDGQLARLIRHGIKLDGRAACFMPVDDFNWLPDSDIVAIVSFMRTIEPIARVRTATTHIKTLGKILDRKGLLPLDIPRRIDHAHIVIAPEPSPTAAYGAFVSRLCTGCHGEHLGGGPLPGAPSSMAVPLNLTPDTTGLAGWTFDDFDRVIQTGNRKNGKALDAIMPVEALRNMNDTEKHALWAYLQSVPAVPFGSR